MQQPSAPAHDAPLPAHAVQTCWAHVPLQHSENVVHAPPLSTQAAATQRFSALQA